MHSNTCVGRHICEVRKIERSEVWQRIHQCYNIFILHATFAVVTVQAKGREVAA